MAEEMPPQRKEIEAIFYLIEVLTGQVRRLQRRLDDIEKPGGPLDITKRNKPNE